MIEVQTDSPITQFAQEAERRRIARELHDGVVQSLTALVADLEYFRTCRLTAAGGVGSNAEVAARLETWQELARESLVSMRSTLGGLRKHTDETYDFFSSIQKLVEELRDTGYTVTCECDDVTAVLPLEYASNLYYVIREAIVNIRKHAHASHITLFVLLYEEKIHISIGDNGIGMDEIPTVAQGMQQSLNGYQQGLRGMRERAMLLGGRLSIESAPGKGTRVDADIPL